MTSAASARMDGPGSRIGCISRTRGFVLMGGDLVERFGAQAAQMLGADEHRSERTLAGVPAPWLRGGDEKRRPAGVPMPQAWGQWAAWAPKIRRGAPAVSTS